MAGDLKKKSSVANCVYVKERNFPRRREILAPWVDKEMKIV